LNKRSIDQEKLPESDELVVDEGLNIYTVDQEYIA
jgi:hypothetical protein